MTLKLTWQGLLNERASEDDAGDAPQETPRTDTSAETISGPPPEEHAVEGLAMAMGSVVELAAANADAGQPADEDTVGELAMAMGGVFAQIAGERPAAAPAVDTDAPSAVTAAGSYPAEPDPVPADAQDVAVEGSAASAASLNQMVVAVVGLRSLGLQAAIALRRADARVIGIDHSSSRLAHIRSGKVGLPHSRHEDMRRDLAGGLLALTEDVETLSAAEAVLICVPTPTDRDRRPDPEPLAQACAEVVANARAGQTLVLTSTARVGSTAELLVEPLEARGLRVGEDVFVAFSPERADPGEGGHEPPAPRVVGAVTERCYQHASALLGPVSGDLHRVSSPQAAEMAKLYENTFRTVNIALALELADACRVHGVDSIEVTDAAATNRSGFIAHYPSAGVGGGRIGVDPHHVVQALDGGSRPAKITEEALRKLAARPRQVVWRAQEILSLSGSQAGAARVLVVGASYKAGIADTSHAPAVEILTKLAAEGIPVDYHDPLVPELRIGDETVCGVDPDPRRDASGFGPEDYALAIVVTVHPGYDYGWLRRVPEVLDCTYSAPGGRRRYIP